METNSRIQRFEDLPLSSIFLFEVVKISDKAQKADKSYGILSDDLLNGDWSMCHDNPRQMILLVYRLMPTCDQ